MKPGLAQDNKNKESMDYGEQCVYCSTCELRSLFYNHHLLFVHQFSGFVLPVVEIPTLEGLQGEGERAFEQCKITGSSRDSRYSNRLFSSCI